MAAQTGVILGTTWNCTLSLRNANDASNSYAPVDIIRFATMGCAAAITRIDEQRITKSAHEHALNDPPPPGMGPVGCWVGSYFHYRVSIIAPGMMGADEVDLYIWLGDNWSPIINIPGLGFPTGSVLCDADEFNLAVSISVTGLFLKGQLGDLSGDNRNILDYTDEYVDYKWYSDGNTSSSITISGGGIAETRTGDWGTWGAGDEVDILVGENFGCLYQIELRVGEDGKQFAAIADIQWGDGAISTGGIEKLYSTNGTTWSRTVPGSGNYWYFYNDQNAIIPMRAGTTVTTGCDWSGTSLAPYIVEYKASAESAAYFDEEGAALGLRFMSNYIVWDDEDTYHIEPVENGTTVVQSVSSWNEDYPAEWQKLTSRNIIVYENEADRVAFGDDLGETDTPISQSDAQCRIPIPRLDATSLELDSYSGLFWANFGAIVHQDNLSVNVPVSGSNRPSLWTSSTVMVDGTDNDLWTLGASSTGNIVQRDFVTWVYDRLNRLAGGYTAGNEYNDAWYWSYKANLGISITGDDPDWHTAKPVEDRTNWSNYRYFKVNITSEIAGEVTLQVGYTVPQISDPFYSCADYRFDEFEVAYSSYSLTWTFDITIGDNLIVIDKFLNNESINPIGDYRLQIVDTVTFTLPDNPAAGNTYDITLNDITLIQDPGDGYHTEPSTHVEIRSKRNWQWYGNNSVGVHAYIDGAPAMEIDYGQSINKEYGIPSTQRIEHCPTTQDQSSRLDTAKPASAAIMDFDYNEGFEASSYYDTVKDSSGNKDIDGNYLCNFYFWDLHPNYTQRAAATIDVSGCKQVGQYRIPAGAKVSIWLMAHPRGRIHGLVLTSDRTAVLRSESTGLRIFGNSGSGWSEIQSGIGTDIHGRYISDEYREQNWQYKIGMSGIQTTVYTREYSWLTILTPKIMPGRDLVASYREPIGGVNAFVYADASGNIMFNRIVSGIATPGTPVQIVGNTIDWDGIGCETDGSTIYVHARDHDTGELYLFTSQDYGETWTGQGVIG